MKPIVWNEKIQKKWGKAYKDNIFLIAYRVWIKNTTINETKYEICSFKRMPYSKYDKNYKIWYKEVEREEFYNFIETYNLILVKKNEHGFVYEPNKN